MLPRRIVIVFMVGLLLGALALSSCAPKLQPEPAWEHDAQVLLDQADGFFAKKQYDHAIKTARDFTALYPKSRHQDRAQFLLGEAYYALRNYQQALDNYQVVHDLSTAAQYQGIRGVVGDGMSFIVADIPRIVDIPEPEGRLIVKQQCGHQTGDVFFLGVACAQQNVVI